LWEKGRVGTSGNDTIGGKDLLIGGVGRGGGGGTYKMMEEVGWKRLKGECKK